MSDGALPPPADPDVPSGDPRSPAFGRRVAVAVVAGLVALAAVVAGVAAARSDNNGQGVADGSGRPAPGVSAPGTSTPTPSATPSGSPAPSATPSASEASPSGQPSPYVVASPRSHSTTSQVEKGLVRDFGYLRAAAVIDGYVHLTFDRATLLTSDDANKYAAAHGMTTPVPNDYLIVNSDQVLRELVLARGAHITGTAHLAHGSTDPRPVSAQQLVAALASDHAVPVMLTFDRARRVVTVAEPFFP